MRAGSITPKSRLPVVRSYCQRQILDHHCPVAYFRSTKAAVKMPIQQALPGHINRIIKVESVHD